MKWHPLDIDSTKLIMNHTGVFWWIAGGMALDLYAEYKIRFHEDIDIGILRKDFIKVQSDLSSKWKFYRPQQPEFIEILNNELLPKEVHQVWIRKNLNRFWAMEMVIDESINDTWIYRREDSIRLPLKEIINTNKEGIPYLKPEIQLLYKGGSHQIREKDKKDMLTILPMLNNSQIEWLINALSKQFPDGHDWIKVLKERRD
jgi:hypothetical protein